MTACIRCGQCCLHAPCHWAQIYFGYTKDNYKVCKELEQNKDGSYTCKMMYRDDDMRYKMLGRGCFYPEWRKEREIIVFGQKWDTGGDN